VRPIARELRPAAAQLVPGVPALTRAIGVLNSLLNTLAYEPGGGQQSFLFWGAWLSHIATSLTSIQDAHGPIVRGQFVITCPQLATLAQIQAGNPELGALIDLLNAPDQKQICPGQ
jgi:hypothetical protein